MAFSLVGHFRSLDADTLVSGLTTIVAYLAFSVVWYVLVCRFPDRWIWRRNISLVADPGPKEDERFDVALWGDPVIETY